LDEFSGTPQGCFSTEEVMTGSDMTMGKNIGERFHVQLSEQAHLPPYDATVDIGMEGLRVFDAPNGTRLLMEIPLDMISRWSMRNSRLLLFTKGAMDREERVVTVIGSQYTIRNMLDTLTSCCMQMAEILEHENDKRTTEQYTVPSADQVPFWSSPDKCGWMHSQGDHIKTWRKRWFILKDGYLFRFSSPEVNSKSTPRGILDLSTVTDVSDGCEATGKECAIHVHTQRGPVYFIAENETAQVEWISALEESVASIVRKVAGIVDEDRQSLSHQLEKRYNQAARQPPCPAPTVDYQSHIRHSNPPSQIHIRQNVPPSMEAKKERAYGGDGYGMIQILNYGEERPVAGGEMIQMNIPGASTLPLNTGGQAYHAPVETHATAFPGGDLLDLAPQIHSPASQPPDVWETHYTEDGTPYYYNTQTGESSWQRS